MELLSEIWLKMAFLFDPVQKIFNGDFWSEFKKHFRKYLSGNILDLACGTGEMRKYIKPKKYCGIDINSEYIKLCRKNYSFPNTKFELGDIMDLKIRENFDTCFFVSAAHHFSDKQLIKLSNSVKKLSIKYFIVVDGYPFGILAPLLIWLDDKLGGGPYFRTVNQLEKIFQNRLKVIKKGEFDAVNSLYRYPYLILRNTKI